MTIIVHPDEVAFWERHNAEHGWDYEPRGFTRGFWAEACQHPATSGWHAASESKSPSCDDIGYIPLLFEMDADVFRAAFAAWVPDARQLNERCKGIVGPTIRTILRAPGLTRVGGLMVGDQRFDERVEISEVWGRDLPQRWRRHASIREVTSDGLAHYYWH